MRTRNAGEDVEDADAAAVPQAVVVEQPPWAAPAANTTAAAMKVLSWNSMVCRYHRVDGPLASPRGKGARGPAPFSKLRPLAGAGLVSDPPAHRQRRAGGRQR